MGGGGGLEGGSTLTSYSVVFGSVSGCGSLRLIKIWILISFPN